jgi:GMP synthase-like glutamine amidotransferase
MSYDLVVFDPAAAPRDRSGFLDWIKYALSAADAPLRSDPAAASPALCAWHRDMCESFPAGDGPRAYDPFSTQATKNATYRFAAHAILAGFHWEVSGAALYRVKKLAQTHGLGLFDASGADGAVWMESGRGRFEVAHRAEPAGATA